jgi:predicted phosphodiesterase
LDRAVRLALISDIHANLEALRATLGDIAGRGADRIVCLGDIVGYNAQPAECIALIRDVDALCVAGNHDLAVCGRMPTRHFPATAARAVAWTQRRLSWRDLQFLAALPLKAHVEGGLVAVHGALHPQTQCATVRLDTDEKLLRSFQALIADASGARIGAFGHTHHVGIYEFRPRNGGGIRARREQTTMLRDDAYYLLNPGSVGQPRSKDTRASYMVVDLAERTVAVHRVAYDAEAAHAATRQAGLAPALSFVSGPLRGAIGGGLRALHLDQPFRNFAAYLGL